MLTPLPHHQTYAPLRIATATRHRVPIRTGAEVVDIVGRRRVEAVVLSDGSRIDCDTRILPGRRTAEIEAVELDSDAYRPGDTVKAAVFVRPYKSGRQRLAISLKLPADLPEGSQRICNRVSLPDPLPQLG